MNKKMSYRTKTIVTTIVILVLSLLISGIYFFYTYYVTLRETAYQQLSSSVESVAQNIEQKLDSLSNAAFMFASTPLVRDWVSGTSDFAGDTMEGYNNIANLRSQIESGLMFNDAWLSKGVDGVYMAVDDQFIPLLFRKATSIKTSEPVNRKVYENIATIPDNSFYYLLEGPQEPAVFYIQRVNRTAQNHQLTFIFSVSSESIEKVFSVLGENTATNIIYQGKVLFSNTPAAIGRSPAPLEVKEPSVHMTQDQTIVDNVPYIMAYRALDQKDFVVQVLTPHRVITQQFWPSMQTYLGVALFLLVLFTIAAGINASAHTLFLVDLTENLERVQKEDYTARLPNYPNKDLNSISTAFNNMTQSIETLIQSVYQSEILQKENEIKLLQSQMNPHFLMNVLATISTMALLEEQQEIHQMVTALSTMLESTLFSQKSGLLVPVEKELEYVQCYLYIQQVRSPDNLSYSVHLTHPSLSKRYIPRLSLQPLVENAVLHGIEPKINGGTVDITITEDEGDLLMVVKDNGVGFDSVAYAQQQKEKSDDRKHIGIHNTNLRLQMLYGEHYGLRFESSPNKGTKASVRLPLLDSPMKGDGSYE